MEEHIKNIMDSKKINYKGNGRRKNTVVGQ